MISNACLRELITGDINGKSAAPKTITARKKWARSSWTKPGTSGLAWTGLGGFCFKSIHCPAQQTQWILVPDLQYGVTEKLSTAELKTGRRDFFDINGLLILKNTLENSWSSASQKTLQIEMIYVFLLKDPWEQVFSPNNLDWTTFQGFRIEPLSSNAKSYIFAPKLYRVFLRKMLFLGSSKIVSDTQLDVFSLSKSVVLTTLTLKIHLFSYPLFLSLLACAATQSKLAGKEDSSFSFFFPPLLVKIQEMSNCL